MTMRESKEITKAEYKARLKAIMTPEFAKDLGELYRLVYSNAWDYIEWHNEITNIFYTCDLEPPSEDFYKIIDD